MMLVKQYQQLMDVTQPVGVLQSEWLCVCVTVRGATWHCSSYPVTWAGRPDLSRCVSDAVLDIRDMVCYVDHSAYRGLANWA